MTSPPLATFDPRSGWRLYRDPADGALLPSVTTIVGFARKEALERWRLRQVAEEAIRQDGALRARAAEVGWQKAVEGLCEEAEAEAARAAEVGDAVHGLLEAIGRGEEPGPLEGEAARFEASARAFLARFRPRVVAVEATVFNRRVGYAGTADLIAGVGRALVVADYKTGRAVHPEAVALQLAALARGEEVVTPEGRRPMPPVEGALVVHLRPEGYAVRPVDIGEGPWRAFRALAAAWWGLSGSAEWVGPVLRGPEEVPEGCWTLPGKNPAPRP